MTSQRLSKTAPDKLSDVPAPSTRYVTGVAIGAALGGYLFGFDTSTMNAALVGIRATLKLTAATVGLVGAIALIGCAAGAWFAGPTSTRFGRNRIMFVAGILATAAPAVRHWAGRSR